MVERNTGIPVIPDTEIGDQARRDLSEFAMSLRQEDGELNPRGLPIRVGPMIDEISVILDLDKQRRRHQAQSK
jgi:hypothetical protein